MLNMVFHYFQYFVSFVSFVSFVVHLFEHSNTNPARLSSMASP